LSHTDKILFGYKFLLLWNIYPGAEVLGCKVNLLLERLMLLFCTSVLFLARERRVQAR
jgi:hypothetical protein